VIFFLVSDTRWGISIKAMPSPSSFSPRERRLRSQLHLLINNAQGFIHGSLIEMNRKCGNPRCRCALNDDFKHRSLYLGQTRGGKKTMIFLPKELESQTKQAVDHFQRALSLLEELNIEARLRLQKSKSQITARKKKTARRKAVKKHKPPRKKS
jgi:hypothetical protein